MLPDLLAPNLTVVFVGTSKSTTSSRTGRYYANPQNMFWNLLEATGLAGDKWIGPSRDETLLHHGVGLTDLVPGRAASSDALLTASDYRVLGFIERIEQHAPAVVAFNGEKAAAKVAQHLNQAKLAEGPATWMIGDSLFYRLPSSSSAHATGGYAAKRAKWVEFGQWVQQQIGASPEADPAP